MRGRHTLCSGGILIGVTEPIQCTAPFCDSGSSILSLCSYFLRCDYISYRLYQDFICQSFVMVILISFLPCTTYGNLGFAVVSHAHVGPETAQRCFSSSLCFHLLFLGDRSLQRGLDFSNGVSVQLSKKKYINSAVRNMRCFFIAVLI